MTQKELIIRSTAIHTIIHEELHMKKVVCHWVSPNLTEHQKENRVRISKGILKLLNDGGHRITSKVVTGDETYMPFFDVPTPQESKAWVFENYPTHTVVKRQRAMKRVVYAVFFRSAGLVKAFKLEGPKTITAFWYTTKCLPEILQEMNARGL
ncbi:uncharacterized protein TNCV_3226531 [Trichonephila clavipes]|nr:uncharacterized protein TNCV_3226531 [Trichonephila clavipes]